MSRRSSVKRSSLPTRDASRIANSPRLVYRTQPELPLGLPKLHEIEDRRTFHPESYKRPARSFHSSHHRLVARSVSPSMRLQRPDLVAPGVAFASPERVLVCVRRKTRKEVLHALRKTGKGVSRKNPRHTYYSSISCKR